MGKMYVGPFKSGLDKSKEPFMLANDAFTEINDAYVYREKIRKKSGYDLIGRLHRTPAVLPELHGNAGPGITTFGFVLTNLPVSPGTTTILLAVPDPGWGNIIFTDNGNGTCTATTMPAPIAWGYGTIDYVVGTVTLFWDVVLPAGPTPVSITDYRTLSRQPVMGLGTRISPLLNRWDALAFDLNRSYEFNPVTNIFDEIAGATWNGSNSDFFWTTNYTTLGGAELFWATNNVAYDNAAPINDGIKYYTGAAWVTLAAPIRNAAGPVVYLRGALMIIPYKDRMIAFNTLEGLAAPAAATRHPQRARWCQNGDPTTIAPAANSAWLDDVVGRGNYIDAPTNEDIVSCWFNKDTVIVFFESSTWQLRYTGNELIPFVWARLNSELGAISTFSHIGFDEGIMAIGNYGIVLADGVNVKRIDENIPDFALEIEQENDGPARVHGIRDLTKKLSYWTYPEADKDRVYPNKVLCFNYEEAAFSTFIDTFTCFGNFQSSEDYTWETCPYTWEEMGSRTWDSARNQAFFLDISAGNQQSFVLKLNRGSSNSICLDLVNAPPSITNGNPAVVNIPDHNLDTGQFVRVYNVLGFATNIVNEALGVAPIGATAFIATFALSGLIPATITVDDGTNTFQDMGNGVFTPLAGITGTIDYETSSIQLIFPAALGAALTITASYSYNLLNYTTFYVVRIDDDTFSLHVVIDEAGTLEPLNLTAFAAYTESGSIELVYNIKLKTKRFTPFITEGEDFRLPYFDMLTDTDNGGLTISFFAEQQDDIFLTLPASTENFEGFDTDKHWNRYFPNIASDFIQLQIELSDFQYMYTENSYADFSLHAMLFEILKTGRRSR